MKKISIRLIQPEDNVQIAKIVRRAMLEFNAEKKGTIFSDPTLDEMFENYQSDSAAYFVAEWGGEVVGGAGIRQLDGTKMPICELQRMFLTEKARGLGIGKALMEKNLVFAQQVDFQGCYIETLPQMKQAVSLYQKYGFLPITEPMGNTGHYSCNFFMYKDFLLKK